MRFVNNEVRMLTNETNNHHKQKDKFGFVKRQWASSTKWISIGANKICVDINGNLIPPHPLKSKMLYLSVTNLNTLEKKNWKKDEGSQLKASQWVVLGLAS